ncbi:MAG: hypothetical protein WCH46_02915 [bacterium]
MPFQLPSGEQIQIDFFNIVKGLTIVTEYFHEGIMLATQTMPNETASIFSRAILDGISSLNSNAANMQITFELKINDQNILIVSDALRTRCGTMHMEIDYLAKNAVVLSQRTSVQTVQTIAEEIRNKIEYESAL